MCDAQNPHIAAIMRHEVAARAELDAIHAELEAMAAEAVAPVPKAEGPQFIESARILVGNGGNCEPIKCVSCPLAT